MNATVTMSKPSYFRYTLKKQNNRAEYRILSSKQDHYYVVQMANGRAINCYHENGEKCQARHFHPGVPCKHMERANQLEASHRAQAKVEKVMQSEEFASLPAEVQEVTYEEVVKCQTAYEQIMSEQINEEEGTPEYWNAIQAREKRAKKAYRKQYKKSQERIQQVAQQKKEVVAA